MDIASCFDDLHRSRKGIDGLKTIRNPAISFDGINDVVIKGNPASGVKNALEKIALRNRRKRQIPLVAPLEGQHLNIAGIADFLYFGIKKDPEE
jgi:hypothetical protein